MNKINPIIFLLFVFFFTKSNAQCFQIESILVDACAVSGPEGKNEMVRFKVGPSAINTSTMSVTWPSNAWQGLIQNATTASKVSQLNAEVASSGGCGTIIEPTGGVLPANAKVVLVTSHQFEVAANYFGAITEDIYILFQDNLTVTAGHFVNYNATSGLRTLTISFGSCTDSVTYQRNLLVDASGNTAAADGATVNFTPSGTPTYTNSGCQAPVEVLSLDAGAATITACQGATITLTASAQGVNSVSWSAPSGVFSNDASLTTNYTLSPTQTGSVTLTLTGTGNCGTITDTVTINITSTVTPTFSFATTVCASGTIPALPTTSDNGVTGTWSPSAITTTGNYTFTPNASQCATSTIVAVTVNASVTPTFSFATTVCASGTIPTLPTTSDNGVTGTWSPSAITTTGNYTFTPNASQCATNTIVAVTVNASVTPTFSFATTVCASGTIPVLPTTSDNGVTGTWSPSAITTTGNYTFTPNASQCAENVMINVSVNGCVIPKGVSPNNDGFNDTWDLSNFQIRSAEIFNRFGIKVYSKENYTNDWRGQSDNNEILPTATYYYVLQFFDGTTKTGWVYLNE